jgi:hypothetical protein
MNLNMPSLILVPLVSLLFGCAQGESSIDTRALCKDACVAIEECLDEYDSDACVEICNDFFDINEDIPDDCDDASIDYYECLLDARCSEFDNGDAQPCPDEYDATLDRCSDQIDEYRDAVED